MRMVTAHLFHSVDGVVSSPHLWQLDAFGPEEGAMMGAALAPIDEIVMGRVIFEEWADYWPNNPDGGFDQFINPVRKHVASRTLTEPLPWQNASLIDADLIDFVTALKQSEGGQIGVFGISVIRQLFLAGLIDALTLTTHPVIAGAGVHLFGDDLPTTRLVLRECRSTSVGNVVVTYGLRTD